MNRPRLVFLDRDLPQVSPQELSILRILSKGARVRSRPELADTLERMLHIGVVFQEKQSGRVKLSVLGGCVLDVLGDDE